jgi:hypothetical protein
MAHGSTWGSRPGEYRGGRSKGTPNKRTLALRQGLVTVGARPEEAALPPALLPLDLMLSVVRDENLPLEVRLAAARYAAPYCHHHKGQVDTNGISQPLVVQILRFSPEASEPPVTIEHTTNNEAA